MTMIINGLPVAAEAAIATGKFDLEKADRDGNTALLLAAQSDQMLNVFKMLLNAGVDLNHPNNLGERMFQVAVKNDAGSIVDHILSIVVRQVTDQRLPVEDRNTMVMDGIRLAQKHEVDNAMVTLIQFAIENDIIVHPQNSVPKAEPKLVDCDDDEIFDQSAKWMGPKPVEYDVDQFFDQPMKWMKTLQLVVLRIILYRPKESLDPFIDKFFDLFDDDVPVCMNKLAAISILVPVLGAKYPDLISGRTEQFIDIAERWPTIPVWDVILRTEWANRETKLEGGTRLIPVMIRWGRPEQVEKFLRLNGVGDIPMMIPSLLSLIDSCAPSEDHILNLDNFNTNLAIYISHWSMDLILALLQVRPLFKTMDLDRHGPFLDRLERMVNPDSDLYWEKAVVMV